MRRLLLCMVVGLWLTGCSSAPAPSPTAGEDSGDPINQTFYQLEDDSELQLRLEPWPEARGKVSVMADASLGDWGGDKPIVETLECRIVDKVDSSAPWVKMERTEHRVEDAQEYSFKASDVAIPSGTTVWVQFKPAGPAMRQTRPLTDWSIKVP